MPQHSENLQAFTLTELKQVIEQLNPLKAPGSNLITAHMIQEMPPEGLQTLLYIFKAITRLGHDVGPCHHGMARPRVADGGVASYMEGSCE